MRVRSSKCIQIMRHYIPIIPKHISLKPMMFHNDLHVVPCRATPRHQIWQQLVTQERLSQGRAHPPLRSAAVDLEADIPSQPSAQGWNINEGIAWNLEHLGTRWNALEALEPQNLQTAELCRGDRTPQQRRYQGLPGAPLTESSPGHADGGTHSHRVLKDRSVVPRWIQRSWARPSGSPGSPNPKGYLWTQPELRWAPDLRTNMN